MGKPKLFDENQEQFILNNYQTMSNEQIATALGENFTRSQINSWLQHRGIKRNGLGCIYKNRIFSKDDIDFIKTNYKSMTSAEMGMALGFTDRQIRGKCCDLGLSGKRRKIHSDYFEDIDSSLKAYFLGFIFADGWIVKNDTSSSYEFGMTLSSVDKYLLELLNDELGGQNIIYHHDPKEVLVCKKQVAHSGHCDTLRVYSKKLVCDLVKHGVETNKSLKNTIPIVDDRLFFDFLRGYIDGDGCYYTDNNQTYMHITCANKSPLEYIQNKLKQFNIKTQIYTENDKKHRLMCTSFNEMTKLVNCLYYQDDLFYLQRKYEKIKHFLGLAA